MTAENVIIKANGSLLIGNPDCIYEPDTEIILTGDGKDSPDTSFGYYTKGIYVDKGGKLDFHGQDKLSWTKLSESLNPNENNGNEEIFEIKLDDEPFGWQSGDKIVIASTDYDMYQAEEFEIVNCELKTCVVKGQLKYSHYGKIYKGVDMRAEVGLLTRNIKIRGQMKDEDDTYGGHIKAFEGFETYRIQGVELTQMGQKGVKGRYPIHWHLTKETNPEKTYAKQNSIHDVFQRCITVHGSHNVHVSDNVAYKTFGHCYFLEDGGEKYTTFHHNLGLVTRAMVGNVTWKNGTIPSDRVPSTFWITSPLTIMTENSAAGSDGVGIWYIFGGISGF